MEVEEVVGKETVRWVRAGALEHVHFAAGASMGAGAGVGAAARLFRFARHAHNPRTHMCRTHHVQAQAAAPTTAAAAAASHVGPTRWRLAGLDVFVAAAGGAFPDIAWLDAMGLCAAVDSLYDIPHMRYVHVYDRVCVCRTYVYGSVCAVHVCVPYMCVCVCVCAVHVCIAPFFAGLGHRPPPPTIFATPPYTSHLTCPPLTSPHLPPPPHLPPRSCEVAMVRTNLPPRTAVRGPGEVNGTMIIEQVRRRGGWRWRWWWWWGRGWGWSEVVSLWEGWQYCANARTSSTKAPEINP